MERAEFKVMRIQIIENFISKLKIAIVNEIFNGTFKGRLNKNGGFFSRVIDPLSSKSINS